MTKHIEVEIPEDWLNEQEILPTATLNEIFRLSLEQLKIARALTVDVSGAGSLSLAAESVGIPKETLIQAARLRGILPVYDEETVREEIEISKPTVRKASLGCADHRQSILATR